MLIILIGTKTIEEASPSKLIAKKIQAITKRHVEEF